jgi:uncharacterized protein
VKKNSVAHFEIYADDPGKLTKFYTTLFDWSAEETGMDYTYLKSVETDAQGMPTQPGGINGGLIKTPPGFRAGAWVNYVNVDSIDDTTTRAQELGAKVTKTKSAVPGMGWFAMFIDPQGNNFAIWKTDPSAK